MQKFTTADHKFISRPIERHNRDLRYGGPNLRGCRGMGTEIGAGVSVTRTDPDII